MSLFGPYLLGVELASMLLLAGLIGAYHLGRQRRTKGQGERRHDGDSVPMTHRPAAGRHPVCAGADRGLLVRRNIIFILISIEIMLNAAGTGLYRGRGAVGASPTGK